MKVIVLGGGDSPEKDVSLRSAKAVSEAARTAGFDTVEVDPKNGIAVLDEISRDTVILPILHGVNGEDGTVQQELEKRKLPYLGSDAISSLLCFDKWQTRRVLEAEGLTMPKAVLVNKETYYAEPMTKKPHVLKILHGGSSIGTMKISDPDLTVESAIDVIFKMEKQAVVEELIEGDEITVPILDKSALPVIEIIPPANEEFDYENKYNGRTQELCPPINVSDEIQTKARLLAEKVHRVMGCRHLSRVDMIINKSGKLYVLEINTIPGLTDQSLYPHSAAFAGLPMPQLVQKFIEMVKRDYKL